MGRRHDEERTRQNRTRQYPGGYDRHGYDERGYDRRGYQDRDFFGPYYDSRGNLFYEDRAGGRNYEASARGERPPDPYDRDYERDRYERDRRQSTGRAAIKWGGIVAVTLILVVGMVMATSNLTGGPSDSAQQAPQEQAPRQAPQQPVQPQQPQAPSPQAPAAPSAPQQDGASSEQVEGMRADIERQLAEIRQSINQLRLEIWSFFTSDQQEQESSP